MVYVSVQVPLKFTAALKIVITSYISYDVKI